MCGIIGLFNSEKEAGVGLEEISYRGRDASNIVKEGFQLGHCLHAINDFVEQPLQDEKFFFVVNCEIYNWKELDKKYGFKSRNDSELLFNLLKNSNDIEETLKELDGVYSFALYNKEIGKVFLTRDLIGVKPLWYYFNPNTGEFGFASEKKALLKTSMEKNLIRELNPRKILVYDEKEKSLKSIQKEFFKLNKPDGKNTEELLKKAIKKRINKYHKMGLLLSGGVDSSFIASILKKENVNFKCYVAGLKEPGLKDSEDIEYAEKLAKELNLELEVIRISLEDVKEYLKKVLPLIEDNNVVKAGVALPFYLCSEKAKEDGVKIMFSGLGSEEIFAGYQRHLNSQDVNNECLAGLRKIYEKDLYRDDVITMKNNIELRLPFLDKELVEHALTIPGSKKINDKGSKVIFREIATKYLPEEIAWRKKKAAQYGSNFDKAIQKLANKEKISKSEYLKKYYNPRNVRLASLMSTGKDSALATHIMIEQNYEISCFITLNSLNQDSYMYHGPNTWLAKNISVASKIPLIIQDTKGEKEQELQDLKKALKVAIKKYSIEGIITGALFSSYQRDRIETICEELGIKTFSPLWHMNQEEELNLLLKKGFKFCMIKVAAYGLNKEWLGKVITEKEIKELKELQQKYLINMAGEGGEYESLVLKAPFMEKEIDILESEIVEEDENTAVMKIKKVNLK